MTAQDALEASYLSVVEALADLDERDATAPTRCAGWVAQDLVHHLLSDAQRALVAFHTPATSPVDTDAVSYWRPFRPHPNGADLEDPGVAHTKLRASTWTFPALVNAYAETAHAAITASNERRGKDAITTQGRSLSVDALRSTLAVEATVHQLDLGCGSPSVQGLGEVRTVLDGLLGQPGPLTDDVRYALVGTGRERPTETEAELLGEWVERLPLFG